jgi:hypothetical protein
MSRLPDARLDLLSTAALETLLMAHPTIAICVRNCPASGVISNVAIPALRAWAQQKTTSDQNPSSMPALYDQMLRQIETSDEHHCKAWQALGQPPKAEDRLWAAIDLVKLCGEPQTVTVRVGMIVTVKAPGDDTAASDESALGRKQRKYAGIKCSVLAVEHNIVHLAPLPRAEQSATALHNWRTDMSPPGRCPPGAEQVGRLRTINMRECDVEIVPCQRVGYQCPMCLQTFVPDLGGVCGMAPNAGGQQEQACDLGETSEIPYEHLLMRQAAQRFAEHVGQAFVTGNCCMDKGWAFVAMGQCANALASKNEKMEMTLKQNRPLCACHQLKQPQISEGGAGGHRRDPGSCVCVGCDRRMGATADDCYQLCGEPDKEGEEGARCHIAKMKAEWPIRETVCSPTYPMDHAGTEAAELANAKAENAAAQTQYLEVRGPHALVRKTTLVQTAPGRWTVISFKAKTRTMAGTDTHDVSLKNAIDMVTRILPADFESVCPEVLSSMRQVRNNSMSGCVAVHSPDLEPMCIAVP